MPKARGNIRCECCGTPVPTGTHVTMYAGRLWLTSHLIAYRKARKEGKS